MSPLSPVTQLDLVRKTGRAKFQVFILVFCFFACLPLAAGQRSGPDSLSSVLDPLIVQLWAISMVVGAALALTGPWITSPTTGLIIEETGLALAGVPSAVYAIILLSQAGVERAGIAVAFILGFAVASLWRYVDIWRYLRALDKVMPRKRVRKHHG